MVFIAVFCHLATLAAAIMFAAVAAIECFMITFSIKLIYL